MWFIIFLIILAYVIFVKAGDKISVNSYRAAADRADAEANAFYSRYEVSIGKTDEAERICLSDDPVIAALKEELTNLMGIAPTKSMLLYGFLATCGRIPNRFYSSRYDANNPLAFWHDNRWRESVGWDSVSIEFLRGSRLKFLKWYDKKLKENGMEYDLMYIPPSFVTAKNGNRSVRYILANAKPISTCGNLCPSSLNLPPAAVTWMPIAIHYPDVYGALGER